MKLFKYVFALGASAFLLSACDSDLDTVTYVESESQPAVLSNIDASYVLEAKNVDATAIQFNWTAPKVNYQAAITTELEMDMKGKSFAGAGKQVLASQNTGLNVTISVGALNKALIKMLESYEMDLAAVDVEFRLSSHVAATVNPFYSNVISTNVTPYSDDREYPKVWVIGEYCGWNHGNSQFLYSFKENEEYEAVVDFGEKAASGFKITGIAGWDDTCNWGTDGEAAAPDAEAASVQLISSGGSGNLTCYSKRFYQFKFNTNTLLLTKGLSFNTISIVGDAGAQVSGWGGAEVDLEFDASKQRFWADVDFADGEIKFRMDHDWAVAYGSKDVEGVLDTADGNNIPVTAGQYRVYVNLNNSQNMTYELKAADYGKE